MWVQELFWWQIGLFLLLFSSFDVCTLYYVILFLELLHEFWKRSFAVVSSQCTSGYFRSSTMFENEINYLIGWKPSLNFWTSLEVQVTFLSFRFLRNPIFWPNLVVIYLDKIFGNKTSLQSYHQCDMLLNKSGFMKFSKSLTFSFLLLFLIRKTNKVKVWKLHSKKWSSDKWAVFVHGSNILGHYAMHVWETVISKHI